MEEHKDTFKLIGANVRRYRKKAKLSQQDLADKFSGDRAKISDIENGKENFMVSTLLAIADGLNVDIKKFFMPIKED